MYKCSIKTEDWYLSLIIEKGEILNSKERILKTLSLKEPDRVPVVPFIISFAAKYSGIKFIEYCRNPVKLAESQVSVAEHFGIDAVYTDSDAVIEAEALGSDAIFFEDEVLWLLCYRTLIQKAIVWRIFN